MMASLKKPSRDIWWDSWQAYTSKLRTAMQSNCPEVECGKVLSDCLDAYRSHLLVSTIDEALAVVSGKGYSCIEIAFMWMGRWRPTAAVVLVYSTMGLNPLGAVTSEPVGFMAENLATQSSLNQQQLAELSALQKHALQAESDISQQQAVLQVVQFSWLLMCIEATRASIGRCWVGRRTRSRMLLVEQNAVTSLHLGESRDGDLRNLSNFEHLMDVRLKDLQSLLEKADELRLFTLRVLLDLLTPAQGASCVVSAFELVFAIQSLTRSMQKPGG